MIGEAVQNKIISNAINAAICIDDQFAMPYSGSFDDSDKAKNLYQAFREKGACALDIYQYTDFAAFESDKDYLLNHKELMILDWELNSGESGRVKYEDALKVLDNAVSDKHIRCVSIYTQSNDSLLILLQIYSYFTGIYSVENINENVESLVEAIATELEDQSDVEDGMVFMRDLLNEKCSGYSLSADPNKKTILKEVKYAIISNIQKGDRTSFCKKISAKIKDSLLCDEESVLSYYEIIHNKEINSHKYKSEKIYSVDVYQRRYLLINNTVIFVLNKTDTDVREVYNAVTEAISAIPNQRTLLLSLIMKDVLYENMGKGGQGFGKVTDNMLLHHWQSYEHKNIDDLIEFLILCMKEDISEYLRNDIESSMIENLFTDEEGNKTKASKIELALFNKIITFVDKKDLPNKTHQIKTGDIFKLTSQSGPDKYFICITQSCDCLRADNINKNFAFALGSTCQNLSEALQNVERKDKYSIIDENIAIEWQNSFLTIHIEDNEFDVDENIKVYIENQEKELEYIGFLKDFYAQRIINKIFNHSLRIGVDLPHFI